MKLAVLITIFWEYVDYDKLMWQSPKLVFSLIRTNPKADFSKKFQASEKNMNGVPEKI